MDTKRFITFLVLSWGLLVGWQIMYPPVEKAPVEELQSEGMPAGNLPEDLAAADSVTAPSGPIVEPWSETITLGVQDQPGHYRATFDSLGGVLTELRLDGYYTSESFTPEEQRNPANWVPLVEPLLSRGNQLGSLGLTAGPSARGFIGAPLEAVHWEHELLLDAQRVVGVRFTHTPLEGGLTIEKVIRAVPGQYELEVSIALIGGDQLQGGGMAGFQFMPSVGMPMASDDQYYIEPRARACGRNKARGELILDSEERTPRPSEMSGSLGAGKLPSFVGVDNKYFAMLLRPRDGEAGQLARDAMGGASWRRDHDDTWAALNPESRDEAWRFMAVVQDLTVAIPATGKRWDYHFSLFAGPKNRELLEADHSDHLALVRDDLGFFASIAGFLVGILDLFHGLAGNWGVAIILLTLTVRIALFPFNRRSQTAMARHATKMKRVQPKIDVAKEKYKSNPQKLRQEQARIMQEEGAFPPLGGCAPVFLQIPVFFGLFSALRVSFDLRQANFLWVNDLSMPDRLMRLDFNTHLPFIGTIEWLNVLPPTMVVLWILQQRVMPKPTDPQAAKMQRMMMWMPVLFGFFLYNYAAGLSIYMITTSIFGIMEYTVVRKIWPIDDSEQPKKEKGKMGKRWGEMMKEAQKLQAEKEKMKGKRPPAKGKGGKR
ncbi:MAG: YidC/Oxa1 family membrane protein insertase [Planctomycetota bacterium]